MLHQKLLVFDHRWSVVGTTNIDMMSFEYLDEINLAVPDDAFAKHLQAQHDKDLARSVELTLPSWRRPLWEQTLAQESGPPLHNAGSSGWAAVREDD